MRFRCMGRDTEHKVFVAIGWAEPHRGIPGMIFGLLTMLSIAQARRSAGCLKAAVGRRPEGYFSFTVWSDPAAMRRFARSGAHGVALRHGPRFLAGFRVHRYPAASIPTFAMAFAAWREAGQARDAAE